MYIQFRRKYITNIRYILVLFQRYLFDWTMTSLEERFSVINTCADERAAGVISGSDPYRELELYLEKVNVSLFSFSYSLYVDFTYMSTK